MLPVFFLLSAVTADTIYHATFRGANSEELGFIEFNNGRIHLALTSTSGIDLNECLGDLGYQWHLHARNDFTNVNMSAFGNDDCYAAVGSHYDPTNACSEFSQENTVCQCFNRAGEYDCQPLLDPFSCEIGDFSGRFESNVGYDESNMGLGTYDYEDPWLPKDLSGLSVALHCHRGEMQFCAGLEMHDDPETQTDPVQKPISMYPELIADFGFGTIVIDDKNVVVSNFHETVLSGEEFLAELPGGEECFAAGFTWHIHNEWAHTGYYAGVGSDICSADNTAGHYDPTAACGSASDNSDCADACLAGIVYDCNYLEDPYSCEVGDLSGKYGTLQVGSAQTHGAPDLPPMDTLMYKSIVLHCANTGARAACAQLVPGSIAAAEVSYTTDAGELTVRKPQNTIDSCMGDACPTYDSAASASINILLMALLALLLF